MATFPTTKFERVAAIAVRVGQLESGEAPNAGVGARPSMSFQDIAEREFEQNLLPFASKLRFPPDAGGNVRVVDKVLRASSEYRPLDGPL